jgi:glutamate racemase
MIGVFDSGIGGLTLLREIIRQLPDEKYCYYADSDHVPYSTKTEEEIRGFVDKAVQYFQEQNVKAIVLACNTATNVCVEYLRARLPFPVIAIQPAVKVATDHALKNNEFQKKILVCATPVTLRSGRFQRLLDTLNVNSQVERLGLTELVNFAEKEVFDGKAEAFIAGELAPYDLDEFSSIVLGCTHFTYFEPVFRRIAPGLNMYDGNEGTARHLKNILTKENLLAKDSFSIDYIESGIKSDDIARFERYMAFLDRIQA